MPNKFCFHALSICCAAIFLLIGCEGGGNFKNTPPSELSISVSKCYVQTNGTITLIGSAVDDDEDSLTISWKASAGSFTPVSAIGAIVYWKAPAEPGTSTITMTVTDQIEKKSKTQNITVCVPFPGAITTSTTIENIGYTYMLTNEDPLRIPAGVTLAIEPGITIIVGSTTGGFEVYGRLVAIGTPANKIRFAGNSCADGSGLWAGIYLDERSGTASLRHVEVAEGKDGISANNGARMSLDSCEIYNQADIGVSVLAKSSADIHSCKIWDNGTGIYLRNSPATIHASSIRYSDGNGIEIDVSRDSSAIQADIDGCTIANNGGNGLLLAEKSAPAIHNCSIFSNGENPGGGYALRLIAYSMQDSLRAEHNFWGVGNNTALKIAALIFDRTDAPGSIMAYVSFAPWLEASPAMAISVDKRGARERAWERLSR